MILHGISFLSLFFVVSKRVSLEAKLHLKLKATSRSKNRCALKNEDPLNAVKSRP
jgi:hypothetical protein